MKIAHDYVEGPFRDGLQFFQKKAKFNRLAKGNVEHLPSMSAGFLKRSNIAVKVVFDYTWCFAGESCKEDVGF